MKDGSFDGQAGQARIIVRGWRPAAGTPRLFRANPGGEKSEEAPC